MQKALPWQNSKWRSLQLLLGVSSHNALRFQSTQTELARLANKKIQGEKKKMKQTKKGFTLVELLVVIAILAILASVSIVGYTSFIAKANLSNDQATISMINRNLQAEFVTGNPASAGEALTALGGMGFVGEKLTPYSAGFHYAYHLESNMFYLLDDDNNVIYPENANVDKADLWGLYSDYKSYIAGVNNYVAFNTVSGYKFTETFAQGTYTFDLNNNYIAFAQPANYTINLLNGYVAITEDSEGSDYTGGENVVAMAIVDTADELANLLNDPQNVVNGEIVIEDILFITSNDFNNISGWKMDVRFEHCVFNETANTNTQNDFYGNDYTLTINDCTFIGSQRNGSAIHIQGEMGKLVITNSKFINCQRGIHIGKCAPGSLIQGNTFNITTTEDEYGYAIRLGGSIVLPDNGGVAITIKDNNFEYCYTPIVLYTSICDNYKNTISGENDYEYMHLIECSNNTFGTIHYNNGKVVFNQSTSADNADDILTYFESIIK